MLAGGIDAVAAAQRLHTGGHVVGGARGDVVQIQRQHVPAGHRPGLAAGPVQGPRHIAAHVFQIVLLALGQGEVGRHGLGAPRGYPQAVV